MDVLGVCYEPLLFVSHDNLLKNKAFPTGWDIHIFRTEVVTLYGLVVADLSSLFFSWSTH